LKIGIFGKSGSGKTTVANFFAERGFLHINLDRIGKEVVSIYPEITAEIICKFGKEYVTEEGIDRKKLGALVFGNKNELEKLNGIFFRYITAEAEKAMGSNENCIVEGAILFESGLNKRMDWIIYVRTDHKTAVDRIIKREGITEEQAELRVNAQSKYDKLEKKADFIIETNGGVTELTDKIRAIFSELKI